MMAYLGDFSEDETIYLMFNTVTAGDPISSCTITNLLNTDVHIHKDDGLAQRNNAAGITVSVDFDGITGSHMIKIDTNDDTVAGFWVSGKAITSPSTMTVISTSLATPLIFLSDGSQPTFSKSP